MENRWRLIAGSAGALISGLITAWLFYLYTEEKLGLATLLAVLAVLTLLWAVSYARSRGWRVVLFRAPCMAEMQAVFDGFVRSDGTREFELLEEDRTVAANHLEASRAWHKPTVFFQLRFKPYINWIDATYVMLLRELSRIGFRVSVMIHDCEYADTEDGVVAIGDVRDYQASVNRMVRQLRVLGGRRVRVTRASSFLSRRPQARRFGRCIYDVLVPAAVICSEQEGLKGELSDSVALAQSFRYLIGHVSAATLRSSGPVFTLVWEGRKPFWSTASAILQRSGVRVFEIVGKTLRDERGQPLNSHRVDALPNLTDSADVVDRKVGALHEEGVRDILRLLTRPMDWDEIWSQKPMAVLQERLRNVLLQYRGLLDAHAR